MAQLWFIRHFRTPWNAEGRLQGRRDIALDDPLGSSDRAALGNNVAELGGVAFAAVWTSPLQRARQTAALHGYQAAASDDRLLELDFGPWEGLTWAELHAACPGKWASAPEELALGESFVDFERRVSETLQHVWRQPGAPILVFGHGAWANCAQAIAAGVPASRMNDYKTPNGALMRIDAKTP